MKIKTTICLTRYGNVIVNVSITTFINQIKDNKPLTVTDPSMTRFLMTLEDGRACIICLGKWKKCEIYVQKSPASSIETLSCN